MPHSPGAHTGALWSLTPGSGCLCLQQLHALEQQAPKHVGAERDILEQSKSSMRMEK